MKNSVLLLLEIVWIAIGIVCIIAGIRTAVVSGNPGSVIFFIMAVISFVFALIRHNQRKRNLTGKS